MSLLSPRLLIVLVSLALLPAQAPATLSADQVAAAVQKKIDSINDFSTDFVQKYEGGPLKRTREERGTLLVKKPGKMRWTYAAPDPKAFVSNGTRFYQHYPLENRVVVSPVPEGEQPGVLFLAGRGNLTRDFDISLTDGPANVWILHLKPKKPQAEYDWLEITAARDTLRLMALTVAELQGSRSTFLFSNFKENPGLSDKQFEFSIPRGAEVSNAGPLKR